MTLQDQPIATTEDLNTVDCMPIGTPVIDQQDQNPNVFDGNKVSQEYFESRLRDPEIARRVEDLRQKAKQEK